MVFCVVAVTLAASQPKVSSRGGLPPLAAEDKAAYKLLANENADAAAMLKAAEKANAAWRQRAAKILQRVEAAQAEQEAETQGRRKRQRFAKAANLVDSEDDGRSPPARMRAKGLPLKSVELRASSGSGAGTPAEHVQEDEQEAEALPWGTGQQEEEVAASMLAASTPAAPLPARARPLPPAHAPLAPSRIVAPRAPPTPSRLSRPSAPRARAPAAL